MEKWELFYSDDDEEGINLIGGEGRILSVVETSGGIKFTEECDQYFSEIYSKEDALKVVSELRKWIGRSKS